MAQRCLILCMILDLQSYADALLMLDDPQKDRRRSKIEKRRLKEVVRGSYRCRAWNLSGIADHHWMCA